MRLQYIITSEFLKKFYSGYLDQNIDDASLNTFILIAQDNRIQQALGYNLYTKILNDIQQFKSPQGQDYITLTQDYIAPALALWTIYEAYLALDTKITNKGLVNKTSEWSDRSDFKKIERLQKQIENNAESYTNSLTVYIQNNPSSFPEYNTTSGINRIQPDPSGYYGNLWLPDDCDRDRYYR